MARITESNEGLGEELWIYQLNCGQKIAKMNIEIQEDVWIDENKTPQNFRQQSLLVGLYLYSFIFDISIRNAVKNFLIRNFVSIENFKKNSITILDNYHNE